MHVHVEFCLVPIGAGTSLSPYIARCQELIRAAGPVNIKLNGRVLAAEGNLSANQGVQVRQRLTVDITGKTGDFPPGCDAPGQLSRQGQGFESANNVLY